MSRTARKSELQLLQDRIEKFQREKFPGQPLHAKLRHMGHELTELKRKPDDEFEWADVFILLLGCAAVQGFTTSNLIALAHRAPQDGHQRHAQVVRAGCPRRLPPRGGSMSLLEVISPTAAQILSTGITCGACGHFDSVSAFCTGQPDKQYQCPHCRRIERIVDDPPTRTATGFVMPGKRRVEFFNTKPVTKGKV
jgi:hypothetical protein